MAGNGVPDEVIGKIMSDSSAQINAIIKETSLACADDIINLLDGARIECQRSDYFGRALLYHLEKFFPKDSETSQRILFEHIEGKLPRQIAKGLIEAIKEAQNSNSERLESLFNEGLARRKHGDENAVDLVAFASDGEMRGLVVHAIKKFEDSYKKKNGEPARQWLLCFLTNGESFSEMQRELSAEEIDLLLKNVFKA